MLEQNRCPNRTSKSTKVQNDVIDGSDESSVHHVCDCDHESAGKCHGQKQAHHVRHCCPIYDNGERTTLLADGAPHSEPGSRFQAGLLVAERCVCRVDSPSKTKAGFPRGKTGFRLSQPDARPKGFEPLTF